jgi:glycolate oxidase
MLEETLLAALRGVVGEGGVVCDPEELSVYEFDGFTLARARPGAVVFPRSTEEVSRILSGLSAGGVLVVARGTGTGLAGGCVNDAEGVVLSTVRMNRILSIDLDNRVAHGEAGVRNTALSDAVAALPGEAGGIGGAAWHFAPDPSSQRASTIGGNAATNAGGVHTLKDFVTSNHVLGVEMVLGDGTVVELGGKEGCCEGGPFDLTALVCGSEGTLGIVTKLWVRLVPKAQHFRTAVALFDSQPAACNVVSEIIAEGIQPAAMEMLDGVMVRVIDDAFHFGFPPGAAALLLIEVDGLEGVVDGQMGQVESICRSHGALSFEGSADPARRAKLWKARKSAFGAIGRVSHSYCTQDACVPRSKLAEVLTRIGQIGQEYGLTIPSAFHAGDGNIHPIFLYDDASEAQTRNALAAAEAVLKYCVDVGGTITGEHGVGVEKLHLMPYLFDAPTLEQFRAVKGAFDPKGQLNMGKLIPGDSVRFTLLKPGRKVPQ